MAGCPRSPSTSRVRGSSSPTPTTPTRSCAATSPGSRRATSASSVGAARASTPPPPTSAAAPSARTSPTPTTRSGWRCTSPSSTRRCGSTPRGAGRSVARTGCRRTRRASARPAPSRSTASRPACSRTARASRAPSPGWAVPAARSTPSRCSRAASPSRPSPTSAGSCRSGAPTATSSGPTADLPRGQHRRVRPARLGRGRARPRLVLLRQHRGPHRPRAGLPHARGRAGRPHGPGRLRRAGAALRRPPAVALAAGGPPRQPLGVTAARRR